MATIYELLFLNLYTLINGECISLEEDGCDNWQVGGLLSFALTNSDHCPKTSSEDALSILSWGDLRVSRENPLENLRDNSMGYMDEVPVEYDSDEDGNPIHCLIWESYETQIGGYDIYEATPIFLRYEEDRDQGEYYFVEEQGMNENIDFYLIKVREFCNDMPAYDREGNPINVAEEYSMIIPADIYDSFRD